MALAYFFIGGAPKSGTTWIQRCLDLHPQITCSGEGHFHEYIVGPMSDMLKNYSEKLQAVGNLVYEDKPYYPSIRRSEQIALTRMLISELMRRRLKPGSRLVGDKTPANAKIIDDLGILFPEMKFIAMLRDPRDVAASRLGHAFRTGHIEAANRDSPLYLEVVQAAATDWRLTVERTHQFAARNPRSIIFIKYEDLLDDPAAKLRSCLDFLGLRPVEREIAAMIKGSSFETLSGGRQAGVEDRASFYRKGVKGDWANHLNEQALNLLKSECGPALDLAAYELG